MKKNIETRKDFQNEIHFVSGRVRLLNSSMPEVHPKAIRGVKLVIFILLVFGSGLVFNSCAGYVSSEPSYVEYDRPLRPNATYIWIEGGWRWDGRSHVYVQRPGYWGKPRMGRSYESGHWQSTPRGKRWVDGHWQKENMNKVHHDR
jgi:hypothetical protein